MIWLWISLSMYLLIGDGIALAGAVDGLRELRKNHPYWSLVPEGERIWIIARALMRAVFIIGPCWPFFFVAGLIDAKNKP